MSYARKTCHCCGMIKPINLMHQVEIQKEIGHTKDKLTAGTVAGALLFHNKASIRRINRRVFANNKRSHVRTQLKWECFPGTCHMNKTDSEEYILNLPEPEPNEPSFTDWVIVCSVLGIGGLSVWYAGKWAFNSIISLFGV